MDKNSELKRLGKNIAKLRLKKGLSQDALAFEADMGARTISRIEVGERDIRFSTLLKIAKVLGVKLKDIVD